MASSGTRTATGSPGTSGTTRSCPSRCVRLSCPRVTSSEAPPGSSSQRRTLTSASGRSLTSVRSATAWPSSSSGASSGGESKHSERPSSARWSNGRSSEWPSAHQAPPSRPVVCAPRTSGTVALARLRQRASRPRQVQPQLGRARGRPARGRHPAARPLLVARAGRHGVLQPGRQHRLVVEPVRHALEPAVEEAHALAERAHGRSRDAVHRVVVPPGPDQAAARHVQVLEQAQDGVRVAVGPAADRQHGTADGGVVLAGGAVPPVVVPALMREPLLDEVRRALEPLAPLRPPAGAGDRRIGRERVPRQHAVGPLGHVHRDHEPAAVVHVVGVAVVARVDADDRAERRRRARRELEPVEAAPRRPHHADLARRTTAARPARR